MLQLRFYPVQFHSYEISYAKLINLDVPSLSKLLF